MIKRIVISVAIIGCLALAVPATKVESTPVQKECVKVEKKINQIEF